jgi:acyl-CoA dehydrogenase
MSGPAMSAQALASDDVAAIIDDQAGRLFADLVSTESLAACGPEHWPARMWESVEDSGLPLALVPDRCGGIGLSMAAAGRLLALSGYHTVPLPLAETILAEAFWAEASGAALEGPVSLGPVTATDRVTIARDGDGFRLNGKLHRVPWGAHAEHILVHAHTEAGDSCLALVRGPLTRSTAGTNLAGEPRADIVLDGIVVQPDLVRPAPARLAHGVMPFGALARSFQMVGAMRRCIDLAVQYAGDRQQFGRPLAKFQAIQQMLAEAAGHLAASEAGCARAAAEADGAEFPFFAAIAKSRAGEAAGRVADICHQVHGATGFTQEHPLHFATRRLWSWRDEFGGEAYWQEIIGRSVCAAGGAALWPRLTRHQ